MSCKNDACEYKPSLNREAEVSEEQKARNRFFAEALFELYMRLGFSELALKVAREEFRKGVR